MKIMQTFAIWQNHLSFVSYLKAQILKPREPSSLALSRLLIWSLDRQEVHVRFSSAVY
jgi:hypothetical protein